SLQGTPLPRGSAGPLLPECWQLRGSAAEKLSVPNDAKSNGSSAWHSNPVARISARKDREFELPRLRSVTRAQAPHRSGPGTRWRWRRPVPREPAAGLTALECPKAQERKGSGPEECRRAEGLRRDVCAGRCRQSSSPREVRRDR